MSASPLFPLPYTVGVIEVTPLVDLVSWDPVVAGIDQHVVDHDNSMVLAVGSLVQGMARSLDWPSMRCTQAWINRFAPGTQTHRHRHSNAVFSTITYFDADSQTEFWRPDSAWGMLQPQHDGEQNTYVRDSQTMTAGSEGMTVVFPSHIQHQSLASDKIRYTLATNWTFETFGNTKNLNSA